MTLETILTMVTTHPLQVLLLGVLGVRALRGVVRLVIDGLPPRPDAGERPLAALVSLVAPAERLGRVTADDRRPSAVAPRQSVVI